MEMVKRKVLLHTAMDPLKAHDVPHQSHDHVPAPEVSTLTVNAPEVVILITNVPVPEMHPRVHVPHLVLALEVTLAQDPKETEQKMESEWQRCKSLDICLYDPLSKYLLFLLF